MAPTKLPKAKPPKVRAVSASNAATLLSGGSDPELKRMLGILIILLIVVFFTVFINIVITLMKPSCKCNTNFMPMIPPMSAAMPSTSIPSIPSMYWPAHGPI